MARHENRYFFIMAENYITRVRQPVGQYASQTYNCYNLLDGRVQVRGVLDRLLRSKMYHKQLELVKKTSTLSSQY